VLIREHPLHHQHGTAGLADACRAYRDALGLPADASLLSIFLDAGDPALVCAALRRRSRPVASAATSR